ncbi:MAG: class II aldolase/adducin family protein [Anaerolineae bacterium]|nr:class II aldolase/adducin family protein [Anaerolineae bacterium]
MPQDSALTQLISLSHNLGNPALDYVILAEGNTSTRVDAESFLVKASGTELRTIEASGFVHLRFDKVLSLLEDESLGDSGVKAGMEAAKVDPSVAARPSVEAVLHALALQLDGVHFVGHTHPTAINALTCSVGFEAAISGRLFPDEIVIGGIAPVVVPYTDPGLPLARKVRERINQYLDDYGEVPKVILMQNHGFIALGKTAQQVENITAMAVKTARVLLGTYAMGGPHFLTDQQVERIHTRPDELYRRKQLGE